MKRWRRSSRRALARNWSGWPGNRTCRSTRCGIEGAGPPPLLLRLARRLRGARDTRRQAGVLREQPPLDRRRRRILAPRAGIAAVGSRLEGRDQVVLAVADQV